MGRTFVYQLYKMGAVDPTYKHIWAFKTAIQRDQFFTYHHYITYRNQKFWRVGESIKVPLPFNDTKTIDYVRIYDSGDLQSNRADYYCFVASRVYISNNVTQLNLIVDYVQTYYFISQKPFWKCPGFVVASTGTGFSPLPGSGADFPVIQSTTHSFVHENNSYAFILYTTIDPTTISGTPTYAGASINGVYTAACPYVIGGNNAPTKLNELIEGYNTYGWTDSISAVYAVPSRFFKSSVLDGDPHAAVGSVFNTVAYTIAPPDYSIYQYGYILADYDYTYIIVNNGQGETEAFHFYEFNGNPNFLLQLSLASGVPTMTLTPTNLKYGALDATQQRSMKITQGLSCVYLNDNFKIWLAQTQNSRAASLAGAELSISQAEEARSRSWAYRFGDIIERTEAQVREPLTGVAADILGSAGTFLGANIADTGVSVVGRHFGDTGSTGIQALDQGTAIYGSRYRELQKSMQFAYDLGTQYLNHELGIETRYTFDHAVANAQQSLNQLVAGWKDKARIPGTARGSNAYGDLSLLQQYGFMIMVTTPAPEILAELNRMIMASGFTVNQYSSADITDYHDTFDYIQMNSPQIPIVLGALPPYARNVLINVLQNGVYLWYTIDANNSNVSPYFGMPYGVTNTETI